MKTNFYNREQSLVGIIIVLVVVGVISGGLYLYLSKQIPEVPKIPEEAINKEVVKPEETPKEEKLTSTPEKKVTSTPEITCQNECSSAGSKRCSNSGYQTCGNYDTDSCLEWGSVVACPANNVCQNGICLRINKILIFIDNTLYNSIKDHLAIFINDLQKDKENEIILLTGDWNSPIKIKNEIIKNKDNLYGIFLIGDLPFVEFARVGDPNLRWISDYYYADTDNMCQYNSQYSFYDVETCSDTRIWQSGPWVARIKPNKNVEQISALKKYFEKNHKYRSGELSYVKNLLYYNTIAKENGYSDEEIDNYINDEINNGIKPGLLYDESSIHLLIAKSDTNPSLIDSEYLNEIKNRYEWVLLYNHGWYGGHDYNITTQQILDTPPNSLFYELKSCSVGDFEYDDYAASAYVFSEGDGLLAFAQTTDTFGSNYRDFDALSMFLISRGVNFADAMHSKFSVYSTWIGDPTLRLRQTITPSNANIEISQTVFDIGKIKSGTRELNIPFKIKNSGTAPLIANTISSIYGFKPGDYFFFRSSLFSFTTISPEQEYLGQIIIDVSTTPGKYELNGPKIISNADNISIIETKINFEVID